METTMPKNDRRREVLEIIEQNPGATGATIYLKLAERSWAGRWFGKDSAWTALLGPSISSIYPPLMHLEEKGIIWSEWSEQIANRPRRRRYYAVPLGDRPLSARRA